MPNPTSLPPLVWLRAFCEAGRRGSFKAAAEELHVTPSTVSHEIRKLEDWVQRPLFERRGPSVRLTREGEQLYEAVRASFDSLAIAFQQFASVGNRPLRIGMLPFFASELVIPRLGEVTDRLGGLRLQIDSNAEVQTLTHVDPAQRLDAVIRFAGKPAAGFQNIDLGGLSIAPVATRNFVKLHPVDDIEDLLRAPRVDAEGIVGWQTLAAALGVDMTGPANTITVDNYVSAMRAIEQGLGIGIAILPLTARWLADQDLHLLAEPRITLAERCWLTYARETPHARLLDELAEWLRSTLDVQP